MVQTIIALNEHQNRIINIIKGKYGLKNKNQAINLIIKKYEEELMEPQIKPEYLERLKKLDAEPCTPFSSVEELKEQIEDEILAGKN